MASAPAAKSTPAFDIQTTSGDEARKKDLDQKLRSEEEINLLKGSSQSAEQASSILSLFGAAAATQPANLISILYGQF